MENIKRTLSKYQTILRVKEELENYIYPYIRKYCPYGYMNWNSVEISNHYFQWDMEYNYGNTTTHSVSLDYFDNPKQYIAREKELNRIAEEEKKEKERLNKIEQEKELLAKLKEKYDN